MLFNQVFFPGRGSTTRPLSVIVGSYLAIGSESGSISSANLEALLSPSLKIGPRITGISA